MRGDRLRELKNRHGYSRKKLATLLDISESNVPRYENGEQLPSSDVIKKMSELFGVTSDYLLGLTDDPLPVLKDPNFSPVELRAIALFREAETDDQTKMLRVLEVMTGHVGTGV